MKLLYIPLFFLAAIVIFFLYMQVQIARHTPPPSREELLAYEMLALSTKKIKKEYGLRCVGTGLSMPGGPIRKLYLDFSVKGPLSQDALRNLLIKCAQAVVSCVNSNEEIQQYLYEKPFTVNNVRIVIYNHDKKNNWVYDPYIGLSLPTSINQIF
jgi:hypothetical protein